MSLPNVEASSCRILGHAGKLSSFDSQSQTFRYFCICSLARASSPHCNVCIFLSSICNRPHSIQFRSLPPCRTVGNSSLCIGWRLRPPCSPPPLDSAPVLTRHTHASPPVTLSNLLLRHRHCPGPGCGASTNTAVQDSPNPRWFLGGRPPNPILGGWRGGSDPPPRPVFSGAPIFW